MLSPEARTIATDVLRPPAGYALDYAAITTYSLDLDVILALPLAVMAQSEQSVEDLLADPMLTLEALREAGKRLDIFVDEASIAVPHTNRDLYALLEDCVHPARAANGGAFHPKLWVVRFSSESGEAPLIRVAVLTRNLTYDRSWDTALVTEAAPGAKGVLEETEALGRLLRSLPASAVRGLDQTRTQLLEELAEQVARTAFPAPDRFKNPVYFEAFGVELGVTAPWHPWERGQDLLAIAPFVNRTALDQLVAFSSGNRMLISRREALDDVSEDALAPWNEIMVLSDAAIDEPEDNTGRPSDLHAKMIALEHGNRVTWYLGSANFTAAAYTGRNVELIASINGPANERAKTYGYGITQFRESGFLNLCEPYRRAEKPPEAETLKSARKRLENARQALVQSKLNIVCDCQVNRDGDDEWRWTVDGQADIPEGVSIRAWPVSVREEQARSFQPPVSWPLPMSRLTAFVAFRIGVEADVDDVSLVLKLPATGMPDGRVSHILRSLIDTPERFLQFLRALLGGLEGMTDWATAESGGAWKGDWGAGLDGETLLEDLVRAAARDPERLEPIRRLIADLRSTPEGHGIVPDDLFAIWEVIDGAVSDTHRGETG